MNERDVVFVPLGPRHLPHPGVVVAVTQESMIVVCGGTGTQRDLPHVVVRAMSREARALALYKDTYFYENNVILLSTSDVTPTTLRCPPELFRQLAALADPLLRQLAEKRQGG